MTDRIDASFPRAEALARPALRASGAAGSPGDDQETITLTLPYGDAIRLLEALQERVAHMPLRDGGLAEQARLLAALAEAMYRYELSHETGQ